MNILTAKRLGLGVLPRLLIAQIILLSVGLCGSLLWLAVHIKKEAAVAAEARRESVRSFLSPRSELWLSWDAVGLDKELNSSFLEATRLYPFLRLSLARSQNEKITMVKGNESCLVFPEPKDRSPINSFIVGCIVPDSSTAQLNFIIMSVTGLGFAVFVLIFVYTSVFLSKLVINPVIQLDRAMARATLEGTLDVSDIVARFEIGNLVTTVSRLYLDLQVAEKRKTLIEVARQLAHDIRSPLTALEVMLQDLGSIPEDKRVLVRAAVRRIQDVANGLLQSAKSQVVMAGGGSRLASEKQTVLAGVDVRAVAPQLSTELLYVLVDELVSEKRLEFRSKLGVQIQFDPVGGYGVFAQVVEADLKRILSNLVNNAVEALAESKGDVILRVIAKNSEFCAIEVCDTGVGIDAATLEKLGSVEVSTKSVQGGKSGSGLGVLSSKRLVQSWGGDLNFDSKPGSGTKVTLTLKTSRVPEWFCSALSLSSNKQIAIVDDDQSIHSVWEERLRAHPVKLSHYANPHQLIAAHRQGLRFDRYLIDYEFLGQTQNGLDLIEKEQIAAKSVLVTSRHNETNVRTRARELQVSIVPKALAALVPIEVGRETSGAHPAQERTVVLLDDDELIRMMWESAAKKDGVELKTFSRWGDLEQWLSENPEARDLRFYIDVELGKGELSGVDIAQKIVGLQRGSVFLATGHDPSEFQGHSFLAGVVGKAPPKQSWKS